MAIVAAAGLAAGFTGTTAGAAARTAPLPASGFNEPAALAEWHPRLEYLDEAPMNDSPVLMAKAPANVRRMYRVLNLFPGFKRSSRIVRFRF